MESGTPEVNRATAIRVNRAWRRSAAGEVPGAWSLQVGDQLVAPVPEVRPEGRHRYRDACRSVGIRLVWTVLDASGVL